MLGKQTADLNKPRQFVKKNSFGIKSQYGRIDVAENYNGTVCITQNGKSIQITPGEIHKLAGCLFAFEKNRHPQNMTNNQAKPSKTGDSYMSKQKEKYPNAYGQWTPEEDARLKELWEMGSSIEEIGERMGRNYGSIMSRLKKKQLIK